MSFCTWKSATVLAAKMCKNSNENFMYIRFLWNKFIILNCKLIEMSKRLLIQNQLQNYLQPIKIIQKLSFFTVVWCTLLSPKFQFRFQFKVIFRPIKIIISFFLSKHIHCIEIRLECRYLQKCFLIWNYYVCCLWASLLALTQSKETVFD